MPLRTFVSRDGSTWNVWNVVPTITHKDERIALNAGMARGWLCFESAGTKRRIVPAPDGWEAWSDDEMERALASAALVSRRVE